MGSTGICLTLAAVEGIRKMHQKITGNRQTNYAFA